MSSCKIPINDIAQGFAKLQLGDEAPRKSTFRWTNQNKIKKLFPTQKLLKFSPVEWEGRDKSYSLKIALQQCSKTTRGQSVLNGRWLLELPEDFKMVILHIVNTSLCSGKYYSCWKSNKVVPIFKKGDLSKIGNWRPITIANVLASTTEKIASSQFLRALRATF